MEKDKKTENIKNNNTINDNELNLSENEIAKILKDIEIESKYLDMIYTKNMFVLGEEWLKNIAFCEELNKQASDLIFDLSKNINDIFYFFENSEKEEVVPRIKKSIVQLNLIFEKINIALIANIYRELYRNINNVGAKNENFLNIIKENLNKIKESIEKEEKENNIPEIEINEKLFEKYDENTIFFFIIKPLLLTLKETALINLKHSFKKHEQKIQELLDFVGVNDKFYNFMCMDKNQNLSDRIILVNASKIFNDLHYLKFDEELIKGLFALNPEIPEIYNVLITQEIVEELNIEFLLKDIISIKSLKKLMLKIFEYETKISQKYNFPDILYLENYLIMTDPKTEEIISVPKVDTIAEFLTLNKMNYDETFENLKIIIEFTTKKIMEEMKKLQEQEVVNEENKEKTEENINNSGSV